MDLHQIIIYFFPTLLGTIFNVIFTFNADNAVHLNYNLIQVMRFFGN